MHRPLFRTLQRSDDPDDLVTPAETTWAFSAIGKVTRWMWPQVESDRYQIDGEQTQVSRRIGRPRSAASAYPQLGSRVGIAVQAPHWAGMVGIENGVIC